MPEAAGCGLRVGDGMLEVLPELGDANLATSKHQRARMSERSNQNDNDAGPNQVRATPRNDERERRREGGERRRGRGNERGRANEREA